jgi:hypothetical protein
MEAYEGYLENGQFFPLGTQPNIIGRRRVILTVLDELKNDEVAKKLAESEKRKLLNELCGSIDDPTFVEPPEIPWELNAPRETII